MEIVGKSGTGENEVELMIVDGKKEFAIKFNELKMDDTEEGLLNVDYDITILKHKWTKAQEKKFPKALDVFVQTTFQNALDQQKDQEVEKSEEV